MRLPTKQLISKIENLSDGLTPQQLSTFLDIIDAMTALAEDAGNLKEDKKRTLSLKETVCSSVVH
jgi:hypothetical protein